MNYKTYRFGEVTINYDSKRVPLSSVQREKRKGMYRYFGAQGVIDNIDDYIYDGIYLLIAEDGENLKSKKQNIAQIVDGQFWVNNHAHIVQTNELCDLNYLFYVFNNIDISAYVTGSAQPKLSQANLNAIELQLPSLKDQKDIASVLSSLDDKIVLNQRINKNLEEQVQTIFNEWFFGNNAKDNWGTLSDIAEINPFRKLTKGTVARYIEMSNLASTGAFPLGWEEKSYNGGTKFINGDTLLARITPCLENGKGAYVNFLNEDEVAFGSTEYIVITGKNGYCNEFFYFLIRYLDFRLYAAKSMTGSSGRQRVSAESIANYRMPIPSLELCERFHEIAGQIMALNSNRSLENRTLSVIRDTLLPKLMSGEIQIPQEV